MNRDVVLILKRLARLENLALFLSLLHLLAFSLIIYLSWRLP